jgi:2-isopropylmalate synthase
MILGKHSGRHAFRMRLKSLGYEFSDDKLNKIFKKFKLLADKKKEIYDEDLEILVDEGNFSKEIKKYELESVNCASGSNMTPVATVQIKVDGKSVKEMGWGDGPVDAVFNAIKKALNVECQLMQFITNNKSRSSDAQEEVTVHIEEKEKYSVGKGTHTDIIIASAEAVINSLNRMNMKKMQKSQKGVD